MDTTRNRAAVLAKLLRAATHDLRRAARRVDAGAEQLRTNALESIDAIAEEFERGARGGGDTSELTPNTNGGARERIPVAPRTVAAPDPDGGGR